MRRFLLYGTGLLLLVVTSAWLAGSYLTRPAMADVGPAPAGAVAVTFASDTGSELGGWLFRVHSPRGAIALMHGVRGHRGNMTARARLMNRLGYTALAFDFQAHGESPGEHITFGDRESLDARGAVRFLRNEVPEVPVFVVGVSLGGAAAVLSEPPLDVDGLVLEAVYADIATAISNRLTMRMPLGELATPLFTAQLEPRLGTSTARLSPVAAAAGIRAPVLILAGTQDRRTTVQDTQRLYDAFPNSKRLVLVEGAAHVDLQHHAPMQYAAEVEAFLSATMPAPAAARSTPSSSPNQD